MTTLIKDISKTQRKIGESLIEQALGAKKIGGMIRDKQKNSFYNRQNRRKILKKQLARESLLVQNNSLEVLSEFERLEDWSAE